MKNTPIARASRRSAASTSESSRPVNAHAFSPDERDAVYRAIRERRDIRHFRPDPIDPEVRQRGFAEAADCPVILIADIDRGGVFAHLVGTLALLSESEQARVQGFVINRFRGDLALLQSGLDWADAVEAHLDTKALRDLLGFTPC